MLTVMIFMEFFIRENHLFSSLVHVFYEQYLTMWSDTLRSLSLSTAAVFIATFFLLGLDVHSAAVVTLTVATIVINLMGLMYWWNISLNAVSLVNLVVVSMHFILFDLKYMINFSFIIYGSKGIFNSCLKIVLI